MDQKGKLKKHRERRLTLRRELPQAAASLVVIIIWNEQSKFKENWKRKKKNSLSERDKINHAASNLIASPTFASGFKTANSLTN